LGKIDINSAGKETTKVLHRFQDWIADYFNLYFTTIAETIAEEIHPTVRPPEFPVNNNVPVFNMSDNPVTITKY
jgi:hypothetical protein